MTDRPKRPRDANWLAKHIVDLGTGEAEEDEAPAKVEGQAPVRSEGRQGSG